MQAPLATARPSSTQASVTEYVRPVPPPQRSARTTAALLTIEPPLASSPIVGVGFHISSRPWVGSGAPHPLVTWPAPSSSLVTLVTATLKQPVSGNWSDSVSVAVTVKGTSL